MSTRIKIEPYLSNPTFVLGAGLFLIGFGFYAMRTAADDLLLFILVWILTICGFSAAVYGFMGIVEGKGKWTKGNPEEIRSLSQSLKVRYPTYILKLHTLKERYERLHEKFPEVRTHSEEFKRRTKAFQVDLIALGTELHANLQKHAPVMDRDAVDGIAQKVLWSNRQIALTELNDALKTLEDSESPIVPERYRSVLNRIHGDFKRLDGGVALYHELLTTCTDETAAGDTVLGLKQSVQEIDTLLSQHETELQALETDTRTRYELSEMALSMFQERLETFQADCEF